jgi:RNA polymerase sigma-70 factor (ECF subfamily)
MGGHGIHADTALLLERIRAGDEPALGELLARHREMLRLFVERRLDAKLAARIDASDVVQEAQIEVARRIGEYLLREPMPFHLWLHKTAYENLIRLRRKHLGAACRTAMREEPLPDRSSLFLAQQLLADSSFQPAHALLEEELARRVRQALAALPENDREVLMWRMFEGLDNQEVAQMLGLEPDACRKRFARALLRLREFLLDDSPEAPS